MSVSGVAIALQDGLVNLSFLTILISNFKPTVKIQMIITELHYIKT
jgi:hypothetical protein